MVRNASRMDIDEKICDFEARQMVKKLKIALDRLLNNQKNKDQHGGLNRPRRSDS